MFNKERILECGESLVGFREDNNEIYEELSGPSAPGPLQVSNSGIYINDLPGVSFELIAAMLPKDTTAEAYLTAVYESELLNLVNQFINRSKQNYQSKELLARQNIISGVASMKNKVTQNERFVGYWFRPHTSNYMKTQIIQLGMQATEEQGVLKIFLYETSQLEPLKEFEFAITKKYSLIWEEVTDWILAYENRTGGTGQEYLIGYYENMIDNEQEWMLQGQALYMEFDCGCSGSPKELWDKYLGILPIEINKENLNWDETTETFNIPQVDNLRDFVTSQTYGLQAKINVICDITDVLCQNIGIFARALQHAIACRILYDAYGTNRINSISDSQKERVKQFAVKYDGILNGYTTPAPDSIRIKGLIDTLTVDFSALDKYCLPCKQGITIGNLTR